jgi:hypothetical protein
MLVGVGPAAVHAQQHASPVARLGAAGPGVDFDIAVVAVGLAGQQGLEFGAAGAVLQVLKLGAGVLQQGFVALHVGQLGIFQRVFQAVFQNLHGLDASGQAGAFAGDGLGFRRAVPKGRVFDPGVQLIELA